MLLVVTWKGLYIVVVVLKLKLAQTTSWRYYFDSLHLQILMCHNEVFDMFSVLLTSRYKIKSFDLKIGHSGMIQAYS